MWYGWIVGIFMELQVFIFIIYTSLLRLTEASYFLMYKQVQLKRSLPLSKNYSSRFARLISHLHKRNSLVLNIRQSRKKKFNVGMNWIRTFVNHLFFLISLKELDIKNY